VFLDATGHSTAMIAIQGFSYRYRDGQRDALHAIDLQVAPGEFLVLTGPSGCGKSTLALAIGGYLFQQYDGTGSRSMRPLTWWAWSSKTPRPSFAP
jgi:energy-coupling factor transporter ATP-binding protein EcfA2